MRKKRPCMCEHKQVTEGQLGQLGLETLDDVGASNEICFASLRYQWFEQSRVWCRYCGSARVVVFGIELGYRYHTAIMIQVPRQTFVSGMPLQYKGPRLHNRTIKYPARSKRFSEDVSLSQPGHLTLKKITTQPSPQNCNQTLPPLPPAAGLSNTRQPQWLTIPRQSRPSSLTWPS